MELVIIIGFVLAAFAGSIGVAATHGDRRTPRLARRRALKAKQSSIFDGKSTVAMRFQAGMNFFYPDRNGRLKQYGALIAVKGDKAIMRVGHPNNSPFPRPLVSLRRVAA